MSKPIPEEIARATAETSRRELEQRIRNWETEEENYRRQIPETIRQAEERAREEAQKWLQEQQKKNQRTGNEKKTEETQKKESLHETDDKLSHECQDHLKKTDEYLNSLDSTKNSSQRPNKKSKIDLNSGQGNIKKKDGEQIQSNPIKSINPTSYQLNVNLKNSDKKHNAKDHSSAEPQIVKVVENPAETKKPTLLIIGIVLIIGSVLAAGYLLGKIKGEKKTI